MSRRFRRFAAALASVAMVSLAMAPFTHGPAARLSATGASQFCGTPPAGYAPLPANAPAGGQPLCPICAAFAASDSLSPPAAVVPRQPLRLRVHEAAPARAVLVRPEPAPLTPPSRAPPERA